MKIIDKKKIAKMALNENIKTLVIYMTFLLTIAIYPVRKAQIALLLAKKLKILTKYLKFSDIFSKKKALILLEITELNQYAIALQEDQQLSYRLI